MKKDATGECDFGWKVAWPAYGGVRVAVRSFSYSSSGKRRGRKAAVAAAPRLRSEARVSCGVFSRKAATIGSRRPHRRPKRLSGYR